VSAPKPAISVIVPAYNVEDTIERCLTAALAQRGLPGPVEVLVVDNGSTDRTMALAARFGVRLISEPKRGRSAARNRGVREASSDLLAFLDADCEADPEWLASSIAALRLPWLCAVQARVQKYGQPPPPREFIQAHYYVPFLDTCSLVTTRSAFDAAHGFDEELRRNVDMDFSFRLLASGYAFGWLPDAITVKHHDLNARQILRRGWDGGMSVALFTRKWQKFLPVPARRVWLDMLKSLVLASAADLKDPVGRRGRATLEAAVKVTACVATDIRRAEVATMSYQPVTRLPALIGAGRSLVFGPDSALLFDLTRRSISRFDALESRALRALCDQVDDLAIVQELVGGGASTPSAERALASVRRVLGQPIFADVARAS